MWLRLKVTKKPHVLFKSLLKNKKISIEKMSKYTL